jgi:hypothetical protein
MIKFFQKMEPLNIIDKTVTCEKCGKTFSTPVYLRQHLTMVHPTKTQITELECNCEKCQKKFVTSEELNTHLKFCLEKPLVKNFKCENCEMKNWHSHIALRKHYAEVHHSIWDICDICGVAIKTSKNISLHKKTVHFGIKEFTCDFCGNRFGYKRALQRHLLGVHKYESGKSKRLKCDKCEDYEAVDKEQLKLHNQAIHIKSVKYECNQCNYFGYRKHCLVDHINSVHKKLKRHKCDHCEMGYFHRRDKIKHMQSKHSIKLNL